MASVTRVSLPPLESAVDLHHGVSVQVRVERLFRSKMKAFQVQAPSIRRDVGYGSTR